MSTHPNSISLPPGAARYWTRSAVCGVALAASYLIIWFVRRGYGGLGDDAHLYALQAMARLQPQLANDVFLKYGSQDDFTVFTPLFAWCIQRFGLPSAQALLLVASHAGITAAGWWIARRFVSREIAWLAAGIALVTPGPYGGRGTFEYAENFLTGRLPGEALVLAAIALFLHGRKLWAGLALLAALLIHPLMAAPCLVLFGLLAPSTQYRRVVWLAAAAGVLLLVPAAFVFSSGPLAAMDEAWFSVVRQRSNFMFFDTWTVEDWGRLALSLLTLALIAMVSSDKNIKRFIHAVSYVAILGMALTAITTYLAPVEILVKGQPWRWTWVSSLTSILLLAPALALCQYEQNRIGMATYVLCAVAWILATSLAVPGFMPASIALLAVSIYAFRARLSAQHLRYVYFLAAGTFVLSIISVALSAATLLQVQFSFGKEPAALELIRNLFGLTFPAVAAVMLVWFLSMRVQNLAGAALVLAATVVVLPLTMPAAYVGFTTSTYVSSHPDFKQWRDSMDQRRNVLWPGDPLAVWFLLESPSYLSTNQASGIAFSSQTTTELVRRAQVLTPLAGHSRMSLDTALRDEVKPLTLDSLLQVCTDPELGYVVAREELTVPHLLHDHADQWRGMRLYSCDTVLADNQRHALTANDKVPL